MIKKRNLKITFLFALLLISQCLFSQGVLNGIYSTKTTNRLELGNYSTSGIIILPVIENKNGIYKANANYKFTDSIVENELFKPFRGNVFKKDSTKDSKNNNSGWKYNEPNNTDKFEAFNYAIIQEIPEDFFVFPFPGKIKGLNIEGNRFASFLNLKDEQLKGFEYYNPAKELFEYNQEKRNLEIHRNIAYYIYSLKYYIDSIVSEKYYWKSINNYTNQMINFYVNDFTSFFEPFYIKKTEVTNFEYKEFVSWVRDSMARRLLVKAGFNNYKALDRKSKKHKNYSNADKCLLNWNEKIDWNSSDEDYRETLNELYISDNERFYRQKSFDAEKLIYEYKTSNGEVKKTKIYPDTLVWMHDYTYAYNEPLSRIYFWHPDYSEHPVVGVSYEQVKAFCDWKTKRLQEEFNKKKLKYKVVVDLPTTYQREFVLTQFIKKEQVPGRFWDLFVKPNYSNLLIGDSYLWKGYSGFFDRNIFSRSHPCDLEEIKETGFDKFLRNYQKEHKDTYSDNDKTFSEEQWKSLLSDLNPKGVSGLKSNVSEWMRESYNDNWKYFNKEYHQFMKQINPDLDFEFYMPEERDNNYDPKPQLLNENHTKTKVKSIFMYKYPLQMQIEAALTKGADDSYYLIQGSNWFDETIIRDSELSQLKTFAPKDASFSTVGFRYVVKLKAID